jgi:hypothetical protein
VSYLEFIDSKTHQGADSGFDPTFMPDSAFDFQRSMIEYAVRKGRAALFEDCGLGKTLQLLSWAQNVIEHTNRPVLVLTPLAVAAQTIREAEKFGITAERSADGAFSGNLVVTNYERQAVRNLEAAASGASIESQQMDMFNEDAE